MIGTGKSALVAQERHIRMQLGEVARMPELRLFAGLDRRKDPRIEQVALHNPNSRNTDLRTVVEFAHTAPVDGMTVGLPLEEMYSQMDSLLAA